MLYIEFLSVPVMWMSLGIILIVMEFFKIPGIGLLFLGLGALTNSIIINLYPQNVPLQLIIFSISSALWLFILWKPLKNYEHKKKALYQYSDIIGNMVVVVSPTLSDKLVGQVKWSGTIMNAILQNGDGEVVSGTNLYVSKVQGNILTCTIKANNLN